MKTITWDEASYYIAAGGLDGITFGENIDSVTLNISYYKPSQDKLDRSYQIECLNCRYFEIRRSEGPPRTYTILDATLQMESELINAFQEHKLDSCLADETTLNQMYHFQIMRGANINLLCEDVIIKTG